MRRSAVARPDPEIARTVRFPVALREKLAADAARCGRSFEAQVIAILRRHYGEDVDIAPAPAEILALAARSLADVPAPDLGSLVRRLEERER
jgi:plasmid stability protein